MRFSFVLVRFCFFGFWALMTSAAIAQADLGPPISLNNSSFEDIPRQGNAPRGWYDCGFSDESPVDVHPASVIAGDSAAFFGVDSRPFDGNTYLGMVVRDNDTYEAVSQRLIGGGLKAGQCYTFSIYLSREKAYMSSSRKAPDSLVNYNTPAKLRIFGGLSYCNRGEVIAESAPVKNEEWLQYNFRFEPKKDHAYIVLEAYYKTPVLFPYNGNILLDAAGKIVPIPCENEALPEEKPVAEENIPAKPKPQTPSTRPDKQPAKPVLVAEKPAPVTKKEDTKLQGVTRADLKAGFVMRIDKLFFKADSSAVSPESRETLNEIYQFLAANEDLVVEIGGHTNNRPPDDYCDWLSLERAKSVVDYMVKEGIDRKRLFAKGYGKREPVYSNRTAIGQQRNQRVEIKVLSMGG